MKEGTNKVQLKEMVTSALVESLTPIRTEMERLEKDPGLYTLRFLNNKDGCKCFRSYRRGVARGW